MKKKQEEEIEEEERMAKVVVVVVIECFGFSGHVVGRCCGVLCLYIELPEKQNHSPCQPGLLSK